MSHAIDPTNATTPARPGQTDPRHSQERTIGQLFAQVTEDLSVIVRKEIQLAKTEVSAQLGIAGKGVGMLVGAGVVALYGLGLLLIAIAFGLVALGLPIWAGFLIVAVVLFILTGILALIGRKALTQVNPRPERAIANAQQTVEIVKNARQAGAEHAKAVPPSGSQVALDSRHTAR
jgi:putative superfamily III holin-X